MVVQADAVSEEQHDTEEPLLSRPAVAGTAGFAIMVTIAAVFVVPPAAALATGVLALLMALITLTDLRHYIIPNIFSYPAVPAGILANIVVFHPDDWMAGLNESLIGAVLGAGTFYLLRAAWFRMRGIEGLGLGDVKLAAVAGAWLGPALLAPACLASALAGLLAAFGMMLIPGRRVSLNDQIPFGSFIAPVILLCWVWRLAEAVPFW